MTKLLTRLCLLLLISPLAVQAEPYLAMQTGYKCATCHVNPSGGGLRNAFGTAFTQNLLAANTLPEGLSGWSGSLGSHLRVGGDLRSLVSMQTRVPGQASQKDSGTEQFRLYADLQLIAERLGVYLDEQVAPGKALRQEAYVRLSTGDRAWYAKAGQFYLPFGWRLQDSSAFVRSLSGISMTVPDKGVELGTELGDWSAQLAYTKGPGNRGSSSGHQLTGQLIWLQPWGRLGAAAASTSSTGGNRQAAGLFGGTRTGPVSWLLEIDLVRDAGYPEGRRTLLATLAEASWLIRKGHNLKFTGESFDPDRHVAHDHKMRYSLVYEYTPIPFVQLRAGYRRHLGIPKSNIDNRRQTFVELHGMF